MSQRSAKSGSSKSKRRVQAAKATCHCCRRAPSTGGLLCFCGNEELRECTSCGEETCQQCRRKGLCYPCRIKQNPMTGSEAALQNLDQKQLQGILQMLHFDKMAYCRWDKEQMVLQIIKRCNVSLLDDDNDVKPSDNKDPPVGQEVPPALIELKPQPIPDFFPARPPDLPPQPPKTATATPPRLHGKKKTSSPEPESQVVQQTSCPPPKKKSSSPHSSDVQNPLEGRVGNEKNLYDSPVRTIVLDDIQSNEDIEQFSVRELQCLLQAYGEPDAETEDKRLLIEEVKRLWFSKIESGAALTVRAIDSDAASTTEVSAMDNGQRSGRSLHSQSGSEKTSLHRERHKTPPSSGHVSEEKSGGQSEEFGAEVRDILKKVHDDQTTDHHTPSKVAVKDNPEQLQEVDNSKAHNAENLQLPILETMTSPESFARGLEDCIELKNISAADIENRKQQQKQQLLNKAEDSPLNGTRKNDHEFVDNMGTVDGATTGSLTREQNVTVISYPRQETHQSYEILTMITESPLPTPEPISGGEISLGEMTVGDIKRLTEPELRSILRSHGVAQLEMEDGAEHSGKAYLLKKVVKVWQTEKFPAMVNFSEPPAAIRQISITSNVSEVDSELQKMLTLPSESLAIDDAFQTLQKLEDNADFFSVDHTIEVVSCGNDDVIENGATDPVERSFSALYDAARTDSWRQRGDGLDIETEFQLSLKPLPSPTVISVTLKEDAASPGGATVAPEQDRHPENAEIDEVSDVDLRQQGAPASPLQNRSSWIVYLEKIPESHVDTMEEFKLRAILRAFNDSKKDLWKREDLVQEVKLKWRILHGDSSAKKPNECLKEAVDVRRQPSITSLGSLLQDVNLENVANENEIRALPTRTLQSILQTYGVPNTGLILRTHYIREVTKLWEKVKALQERDLHIEIERDPPGGNHQTPTPKTPPLHHGHQQEAAAPIDGERLAKHGNIRDVAVLANGKDNGDGSSALRMSNGQPLLRPGHQEDDNEQDLSRVQSLSDIPIVEKIDRLTIDQIKWILQKHLVPCDDGSEKDELVSKLQCLWHDWKNADDHQRLVVMDVGK